MILYAGFGVAVANAREEVKSVADIITAKNTDHGVAVFIKQYLFDEKEENF
jgi:hydroxymethylpyrimidine pyrophosphatase-like HAD family hydrolase